MNWRLRAISIREKEDAIFQATLHDKQMQFPQNSGAPPAEVSEVSADFQAKLDAHIAARQREKLTE